MNAPFAPGQPAKVAIVLACDQNYFFLAQDLVLSLNEQVTPRHDVHVACIDIGMESASTDWLRAQGVQVLTADAAPIPAAVRECIAPFPYMMGQVVRPYLPDLLPEHDIIIHLDCDVWVQNDEFLTVLLGCVAETPEKIALAPSTSHYSSGFYDDLQKIIDMQRNWTYACIDKAMADALSKMAFFSSGVFAAHRRSPVWQLWADEIEKVQPRVALINPKMLHLAEQTALNIVVRMHNLVTVLDPICNFHCNSGGAMRDPTTDKVITGLVSPRREISIVHLAAWSHCKDMYAEAGLRFRPTQPAAPVRRLDMAL